MDGAFLSRFSNSGENKSASCLHCQILYVPTAFFVQYVPMKNIKKHTVVAISTLLTPIRVLLDNASNSWPFMTLGIVSMVKYCRCDVLWYVCDMMEVLYGSFVPSID